MMMTMVFANVALFGFLVILALCGDKNIVVSAFSTTLYPQRGSSPSYSISKPAGSLSSSTIRNTIVNDGSRMPSFQLFMGLYDTPLPPRPVKRNETLNRNDDDEEDDDDIDANQWRENTPRLFQFNKDGIEINNLLPPLGRSLQYGVDCYYEVTDRLVKNLVDKTDCHPMDAAWSLEACKGDITEAWTCISTARRQTLNRDLIGNDDGLSSEVSELMSQNEYEILKEERLQKEKEDQAKQSRKDLFGNGVADQPWLPNQNPKPIDDEPWFTG